MNGRLRHVEVWDGFECAGGTRQAVLAAVSRADERRALTGDDALTVRVPPQVPGVEAIRHRYVLRVVDEDGAYDEWRIATSSIARNATAELVVECVPPMRELTDRVIVRRVDGDGSEVKHFETLSLTPTQHLESFILPSLAAAGQGWWTIGTVDADLPLGTFMYDWSTPMEALRRMAEDVSALAGVTVELEVTRVGAIGYAISLVTGIGAALPTIDVRIGKNYAGGTRKVDGNNQATVIYGRGAEHQGIRTDISTAEFTVSHVDAVGNLVQLADPWGGPGPLAFDDQLNGYQLRLPDGSARAITDSIRTSQQLHLGSGVTGLAVGDRVRLLNADGRSLDALTHPTQVQLYERKVAVLDRPDIPATLNIVRNSAARSWPAGNTLPDNWTFASAVVPVTKNVNPVYTRFGGASMLVSTTNTGEGVQTTAAPITPTATQPFFSGFGVIWVLAGRVRVELVFTGLATVVRPSGTDQVAHSGDQLGQWLDLGIANVDGLKIGATGVAVRIVQDGPTPAQFYVDAAQVTQTIGQRPYLDGNGANLLWHAVNRRLLLHGAPTVTVAPELVDLSRADPTLFPYDAIGVGGRAAVTDEEMNVRVETRIVGFTRELTQRLTTKVDLSNLPTDLTDALARPTRPPPAPRAADSGALLTLQAFWEQLEPGNILMRLAAQPEDAVVFYLILDELDVVPPMGDAAWLLYNGPRTVTVAGEDPVKLVAYAQIGERRSSVHTWMIDANREANIASVSSNGLSATQVQLTWVPDDDTVRVVVYRKQNGIGDGYPTTDGSADPTQLLPALRIANMAVDPLGTSEFPMGTQVMGGTSVAESGFAAGDVIGWAVVPFDRNGKPGEVAWHKMTFAGVVTAGLVSVSFDSIIEGAPNQGVVSWVPNGAVTSAHKLHFLLYAGGVEFDMGTFVNPLSGSPRTFDLPYDHSSAKNAPEVSFWWRVQLLSSGDVVLGGYRTETLSDTVVEEL